MSDRPRLTPEQAFELHKLDLQHASSMDKARLEHDFQKERLQREERFTARKQYAEHVHAERLQFGQYFKEYGQLTLRSLFILNGGSVAALLAFIGSSLGKVSNTIPITPALFTRAFTYYAAGLGCVAVAHACAYLNYQGHMHSLARHWDLANNMMNEGTTWPNQYTKKKHWFINATWVLSMLLTIASVVFFVLGSLNVRSVFSSLV